jgi:hypothetical protein
MKTPATVCILIFLLFTLSCASSQPDVQPQVLYDYNVNYEFNKLQTYAWRPLPAALKGDKFIVERIYSAVDRDLQAKGYRRVESGSDFQILLFGIALEKVDSLVKASDKEGRLKLSFYETRSDDLIWWGETRARVKPNSLPEEKDRMVNDAVERILEKFPPSS